MTFFKHERNLLIWHNKVFSEDSLMRQIKVIVIYFKLLALFFKATLEKYIIRNQFVYVQRSSLLKVSEMVPNCQFDRHKCYKKMS